MTDEIEEMADRHNLAKFASNRQFNFSLTFFQAYETLQLLEEETLKLWAFSKRFRDSIWYQG
jgi:hypothetical protein